MKKIIDYVCTELDKKNIRLYDSNILRIIRVLPIEDIKLFEIKGKISGVEYLIEECFNLKK